MAKPDPALLNPARYPFTTTIEPRFGDLDVNLHVNKVCWKIRAFASTVGAAIAIFWWA